jgi:hypothetical protein
MARSDQHTSLKYCNIDGTMKTVNNCWYYIIITFYLETSGDLGFNLCLNDTYISTLYQIRRPWQLKTATFLHWYLVRVTLLQLCL